MAPTRAGLAGLGLTVLVAMAALNTGANLLFLVLALLLSTWLLAAFEGRRRLRRAELSLQLPDLVEAGAAFHGAAEIEVRAGRGPCDAVFWVRDGGLPAGGVRVVVDGGRGRGTFKSIAPARAVIEHLDVELLTRSPWHLIEHRRRLRCGLRSHVHPRLGARPPERANQDEAGSRDAAHGGDGGSLRNLRGYLPGDDRRLIHWKASARRFRGDGSGLDLLVREHHAEDAPRAVVVLDTRVPEGPGFEAELERAASEVSQALLGGGGVDFSTSSFTARFAGGADRARALRWFAGARPEPLPVGGA